MDGEGLRALRGEIDRIDTAMHDLLMERASVIERLVAAKRRGATAFRPDREAAVLRRLAERHRGSLPFDAVEAIWRVLMATFVHAQAPFTVHAEEAGDERALSDSVRFHFGFAVPYRGLVKAGEVVAAVAATPSDLGVIRLDVARSEPWWRALEAPNAPKVIARLPFLPRPTHPAPEPVLVIAGRASETAGAIALYSGRLRLGPPGDLSGCPLLATAEHSALAALGPDAQPDALDRTFAERPVRVGDYPEPVALRP